MFVLLEGEEKDANCVFRGRAVNDNLIKERRTSGIDIIAIAAAIYRDLNIKN